MSTFATDRKLRNAVEIGKFPPQKVSFNLHFPTFRGGVCVQLTDLSQANSLPVYMSGGFVKWTSLNRSSLGYQMSLAGGVSSGEQFSTGLQSWPPDVSSRCDRAWGVHVQRGGRACAVRSQCVTGNGHIGPLLMWTNWHHWKQYLPAPLLADKFWNWKFKILNGPLDEIVNVSVHKYNITVWRILIR